jgi:hypothetical protein
VAAGAVKDDNGTRDAGVDEGRSEYHIKERRLVALWVGEEGVEQNNSARAYVGGYCSGGLTESPEAVLFRFICINGWVATCTRGALVDSGGGKLSCVTWFGLPGLGMFMKRLLTFAAGEPLPRELGLRLLRLPIGLVKPLQRPASRQGATTAISSEGSENSSCTVENGRHALLKLLSVFRARYMMRIRRVGGTTWRRWKEDWLDIVLEYER